MLMVHAISFYTFTFKNESNLFPAYVDTNGLMLTNVTKTMLNLILIYILFGSIFADRTGLSDQSP